MRWGVTEGQGKRLPDRLGGSIRVLAIVMLALIAGCGGQESPVRSHALVPVQIGGRRSAETEALVCFPALPQIKPVDMTWKCLNHGGIFDITWSRWDRASAEGHGTVEVDRCSPGCIADNYWSYPATLTLSQPKRLDGQVLFSMCTLYFNTPVPFGPQMEIQKLVS
jgi:hypothetical protein